MKNKLFLDSLSVLSSNKVVGSTFSKLRPKRVLIKQEDGTSDLEYIIDKKTGVRESENVYDFVQEQKDLLFMPSSVGVVNSSGQPVSEEILSKKKMGKFGDFRNSPKTIENLLLSMSHLNNIKSHINKDGSLNKNFYEIIKDNDVEQFSLKINEKNKDKDKDKKDKVV